MKVLNKCLLITLFFFFSLAKSGDNRVITFGQEMMISDRCEREIQQIEPNPFIVSNSKNNSEQNGENRLWNGPVVVVKDVGNEYHWIGLYENWFTEDEKKEPPIGINALDDDVILTGTSLNPALGWTIDTNPTMIDPLIVTISRKAIDLNSSGFGVIVGPGHLGWHDPNTTYFYSELKITYATTNDYGLTWSNWDTVSFAALGFPQYHKPEDKLIFISITGNDTTWYDGPTFMGTNFDMDVIVDDNNYIYVGFNSLWGRPSENGWYPSPYYNGVFMARKRPGYDWEAARIAYNNGTFEGDDYIEGRSQYFLKTEVDLAMDESGNLYATWLDRRRTGVEIGELYRYSDNYCRNKDFKTDIYASRSSDGGFTWSIPINCSDTPSIDEYELKLSKSAASKDGGTIWLAYSIPDLSNGYNPDTDFYISLENKVMVTEVKSFQSTSNFHIQVASSLNGYGWLNPSIRCIDRYCGVDTWANTGKTIDFLLVAYRKKHEGSDNSGYIGVSVIDLKDGLENGIIYNYKNLNNECGGIDYIGGRYPGVVALDKPFVAFNQYMSGDRVSTPAISHPFLVTSEMSYGIYGQSWTTPNYRMNIGWLHPKLQASSKTTIITHGFTAEVFGDDIKWEHYRWQMAMADAIPNRQILLLREGKFYQTYLDYNGFKIIWEADPINKVLEADFTEEIALDPTKNTVIVFDWVAESDIHTEGYTESAANVLTASLLNLANENPWLVKKLHFIGHSRGAVVNSEATQRLIYLAGNECLPSQVLAEFDKDIHMTTLDAHPAGHWTYIVPMKDDHVNSENIKVYDTEDDDFVHVGVSGWKSGAYKVGYIDNYFHPTGTIGWLSGICVRFRGLNNIPGSNENYSLNPFFTVEDVVKGTHSRVHTWYYGTIDTLAEYEEFGDADSREIRRDDWYNETGGSTQGFYYSDFHPEKLSKIKSNESGLYDVTEDKTLENNLIFNGDFSLNGVNEDYKPYSYNVPGWDFQGGGGLGQIYWGYLHMGIGRAERTTNWFYVLDDKLYFSITVTALIGGGEFVVSVLSENGNRSSIIEVARSYMNNSNYSVDLSNYLHQSVRLKFETVNKGFGIPEVSIDNIGFKKYTSIDAVLALNNVAGKRSKTASEDGQFYFHAYDEFGNHTGQIDDTTWVTEIPGSRYYVSADSLVKIISLPEGQKYQFKTESFGKTGLGSLTIDDFSDGKGATSVLFDSINVGANTITQTDLMQVSPNAVLHLDNDGDGTFEETVESTYLKNYSIVVTKIGNGTVTPEGTTTVLAGSNVEYTITPNDGESIIDVVVDGVSKGQVSSFTISDIQKDVEVNISFTSLTYLDDASKKDNLKTFNLHQNYPNPFNPTTTISYTLPKSAKVIVDVFNSLGQKVKTLIDKQMPSGLHQVKFNAENLPSGVYFFRLQAGEFQAVKKMLLIR